MLNAYVETVLILWLLNITLYITGESDSFGQIFLVRRPYTDSNELLACKIYVTTLTIQTNVAVWGDGVIVGSLHNTTHMLFDSLNVSSVIYIYTDHDISVNVFLKIEDSVHVLPVYPVDTYGTEFQTMSINRYVHCQPVSEYKGVSCSLLYNSKASTEIFHKTSASTHIFSGGRFQIDNTLFFNVSSGIAKVLRLQFNKPTTLFCFEKNGFIMQQLPFSTWSTQFYIPVISNLTESLSLELKMYIFFSSDNTTVHIFDSKNTSYAYERNGRAQKLDASRNYNVTASTPIAVVLEFKKTLKSKLFMNFPPISSFLKNGVFTSVPVKAIREYFNVSQIQSYSVTDSGEHSHSEISVSESKEFFYNDWSNVGTSYGFSVAVDDRQNMLMIPGFTRVYNQLTEQASMKLMVLNVHRLEFLFSLYNWTVYFNKWFSFRLHNLLRKFKH